MKNLILIYDELRETKSITRSIKGCNCKTITGSETLTETSPPLGCGEGERMILFLKELAKTANGRGVVIGDIISRVKISNDGIPSQYKYTVQYDESLLAEGITSISQCDIDEACCYDCAARLADAIAVTSLDQGCGILINDDDEISVRTSGVWGEGEFLFANSDAPFTAGAPIYCGNDGELRTLPEQSHYFDTASGNHASPILSVTKTLTNPSAVRSMRVFVFAHYGTEGTIPGTGGGPPVIEYEVDLDGVVTGPFLSGLLPFDSGNSLQGGYETTKVFGFSAPITLLPGESKDITVSFNLQSGDYTGGSTGLDLNILGFTI